MTAVLRTTLARERRPLLGWLAGIGLLGLVTAGSWPAVRESGAELEQVLQQLPPAFTAFFGEGFADFSAAGIVGSRLFGSIGLALVVSLAVSRGARAIAGEEQDGTLELLVTQPISRTAIAVDKAVAMFAALAVVVLGQMVLLLVMMPVVGLDFPVAHVVAASAGLYALAALFGGLAFAVGAATGSRGLAVGVGAGAAAGLFVLTGLGALVDGLESVAELSPFSRFDGTRVLAEGIEVGPVAVFAAVAVLLVALGVWVFDRRDLP
jgi:ABC-2 type transport system permease protein